MSTFIFFMQQMIIFTVPLIIAATAGMFCERCGIVYIGIEGNMVMGAFCGSVYLHFANAASTGGQGMFLLAILIAGLGGIIASLLISFAAIGLNANQAMCGVALNIIAPAIAVFFSKTFLNEMLILFNNTFIIREVPFLSKIPIIGDILFKQAYVSVYIAAAIFIAGAIVMNKTKFGMRLKACGENPHAADAVGINVRKIRFISVTIAGFFAGVAGIVLIVQTSVGFAATVSGYGFLAMAVLILGRWRPKGIMWGSLLFGVTKTLSTVYAIFPGLNALNIDAYLYRTIPFLFTLLVLASFKNKNQWSPRAANKPYIKGER